jgi:hypothetical protein
VNAYRVVEAIQKFLKDEADKQAADILGGQVSKDTYEVRKARRLAYVEVLGALPGIIKKVENEN